MFYESSRSLFSLSGFEWNTKSQGRNICWRLTCIIFYRRQPGSSSSSSEFVDASIKINIFRCLSIKCSSLWAQQHFFFFAGISEAKPIALGINFIENLHKSVSSFSIQIQRFMSRKLDLCLQRLSNHFQRSLTSTHSNACSIGISNIFIFISISFFCDME